MPTRRRRRRGKPSDLHPAQGQRVRELRIALGLTPDELTAQFAAGQTLAQIAEAQGVSQGQLTTAHQAAMTTALEQAVADGVLTQAQADQMLAQMTVNGATMFTHMGGGFGPGNRRVPVNPQTVP